MKKIFLILLSFVILFAFAGCGKSEENLNSEIVDLEAEINSLHSEISELQKERDALKEEVIDAHVENGTAKYVVTFNIKQNHYTFDLTEHFKDALNDISITIPVDKEYYESVEVGQKIDNSFRMGSFLFKGSFGSWDVTVESKEILYE